MPTAILLQPAWLASSPLDASAQMARKLRTGAKASVRTDLQKACPIPGACWFLAVCKRRSIRWVLEFCSSAPGSVCWFVAVCKQTHSSYLTASKRAAERIADAVTLYQAPHPTLSP